MYLEIVIIFIKLITGVNYNVNLPKLYSASEKYSNRSASTFSVQFLDSELKNVLSAPLTFVTGCLTLSVWGFVYIVIDNACKLVLMTM